MLKYVVLQSNQATERFKKQDQNKKLQQKEINTIYTKSPKMMKNKMMR